MDLLIFDLDGTLIDSRLDLANAVNAMRSHRGMSALPNERSTRTWATERRCWSGAR
jgi:phosphoglycolate phosphatase